MKDAIALNRIPTGDIICGVESAIDKCNEGTAEEFHPNVSRILRTFRPPSKNYRLKSNKACENYNRMRKSVFYWHTKKTPFMLDLEYYENIIVPLLHVIPREKSSRWSKFYGSPKTHEEETLLIPFVSSRGPPLQQLARYLAKTSNHMLKK